MSDRWIEAEFEAIFREHYQRIVRVIRRVLQRDSEAEEVCAEVFFRLYPSTKGRIPAGSNIKSRRLRRFGLASKSTNEAKEVLLGTGPKAIPAGSRYEHFVGDGEEEKG